MKIVFHSNKLRLFKSVGRKIVISLAAFVLRLIPGISSDNFVLCVANDINAHKKDSKSLAVPLFCLIFAMYSKGGVRHALWLPCLRLYTLNQYG